MTGARNYLAFDLGAESGRAIVGRLEAGRLTLAEKHRFLNPNGRINGQLQWNLLAQWEELKTGLRKAAGGGAALAGIGVDTWGVDFGLLNRNGDILGNPFMYRDSRTEGMMERAFARVPKAEIFEATGIQFMQLNSLYQLLAMKEAGSSQLDCAATLLFVPDLFNYLFTGQKKAEFSIATTSQMYDPRAKTWAKPMLERLGLPTRILPGIIATGTVMGPLLKEVAAECEVAGEVPVIAPGCHDTASAVVAVPAETGREDWCYISSGTWSLMGAEIPSPVINEKTLRYNYTNEGGIDGTTRLLKNIMGLWLVQECRRHWIKEGTEHSYADLTRMAGEAQAFKTLVNPDHKPFLSPGEMPRKIEAFCRETGQPAPQTAGEFVRCCLESLALTYRRTVEGLEDILGRRMNTIHIVGGGAQNGLLNQMTADACGRTVVAGPVEATAIGNILVQARAVGDVKDLAEIRSIVRNGSELKRYEPSNMTQWDSAYVRFRQLL